MIRSLFSHTRPVRDIYIAGVAVLLLLMAGIGLAQGFHWGVANPFNLNRISQAAQPVSSGKVVAASSLHGQYPGQMRAVDSYSAQLALLEQRAHEVSRFGKASSYAIQLENLAQRGRAAFAASRLPLTANDYAYYLDSLRLLDPQASAASIELKGANSFSAYTEKLFREARDTSVRAAAADTPSDFTETLDNLRRLGQAAYAEQGSPAGPNRYVTVLDDLRRMGAEAMTGGAGQ